MQLQDAKRIAIELMCQHGLLDSGWYFEFDSAVRRAGCCNYCLKKISLSARLTEIRDEAFVRDTILHEIAHALVGYKNGHNRIWKAKAKEIGCNGQRCYSDVRMDGKYKITCPNGHTSSGHRKPKGRRSCAKCNPKSFDERYLLTYELK